VASFATYAMVRRTGPDDMVWIPGGPFAMGGEASFTDALPVHEVEVNGFWIDRTEVTNAQFARFVEATGYVTIAEQTPKAEDFPGAPPENLVAGSIVFDPPDEPIPLDNHLAWWSYVPGADWKHPEGPGSDIAQRHNHPVVHVCWLDAVAYANWCGKRLPTEAEWEFAARGGLVGQRFVWGNRLLIGENWQANIWQGRFPVENTADDGFAGTAPVASFPPNGYGLFDTAGNVWEWCSDWYRPDYYAASSRTNPRGPPSSHDPQEPGVPKRVQRGGSYLCSDVYCARYRPGARGKGAVDSGATHIGFRCVKDAD
ncbi:MAG TPA: formylglycine-generating enzyme family protein, partial [Pirellulales bacterium]|nr:formylglycine-generating enzyme family protein [Pirellulales bacterium]